MTNQTYAAILLSFLKLITFLLLNDKTGMSSFFVFIRTNKVHTDCERARSQLPGRNLLASHPHTPFISSNATKQKCNKAVTTWLFSPFLLTLPKFVLTLQLKDSDIAP